MILNLLTTLILAQTGIPAYSIPPSQERVIVFSDRGRVYIVGIETNSVKFLDDTTPPTPPTPPVPVNNLTGQAKAFYNLAVASVPDQANRQMGAKGLIDAIDATTAQIGGLGLSLEQAVTTLASYAANNAVNRFWVGVKLGDFLDSQQVTTIEQLSAALVQIRKACEVLAK